MEIITDLQRILWHEIGHFCVDLLDIETNDNFSIDGFRVSYYETAISEHKWSGSVKTIPSINSNVLIENKNKTSFAILNLISGCMFQTVFLKEILNFKVVFEDCFCSKGRCAGLNDNHRFLNISSNLRNKHGRNEDFEKFTKIELLDNYYKIIVENRKFLEEMNNLIIVSRDKIFEVYQQSKNKSEFHYNFTNNEIEILKKEVYNIMLDTLFRNSAILLKESILQKMIAI